MADYGLQLPNFTLGVGDDALFERVAEMAVAADDTGFSSLWVMDHFYQLPPLGGPTQPMFEAYTLLGALAARTRRVQLGALVTGVTYRYPAVLAKQVTTLDVISGGRAILGLGAAWYEEEHDAYGIPFPSVRERMDRMEETARICRAMFTEETPSFRGRYYSVDGVLNLPRPLQVGGPPILIGGSGRQRTLRAVARHADACNIHGGPAAVRELVEVLHEHCAREGRDPAEIRITRLGSLFLTENDEEAAGFRQVVTAAVGEEQARERMTIGPPDRVAEDVQALVAAGVDELIFNLPSVTTAEQVAAAGNALRAAVA
ncbi:MAG TPA: LLM class F420-dependent oxidoreductase [Mycobacteriales bacterium]|nr:LLM class F420-dependent oxidoreductase [Mycobacteriales bacterium]